MQIENAVYDPPIPFALRLASSSLLESSSSVEGRNAAHKAATESLSLIVSPVALSVTSFSSSVDGKKAAHIAATSSPVAILVAVEEATETEVVIDDVVVEMLLRADVALVERMTEAEHETDAMVTGVDTATGLSLTEVEARVGAVLAVEVAEVTVTVGSFFSF